MQNEQRGFDQFDLAEIWRSAQHRRTVDIYSWLADWWKLKLAGTELVGERSAGKSPHGDLKRRQSVGGEELAHI